jgi:hypothetical protein
MKTNAESFLAVLSHLKFRGWNLYVTALVAFVAGSFFTSHFTHLQAVRADSSRVFELMVYHTLPGKAPALESVFRDVSKLQTKHNLNAVGYWVPGDDSTWKNTFIYLVVHPSLEEANKNWDALHADPAFLPYRKAAAPLIEQVGGDYNVDEVYMRPTDYSPMK